MFTSVESVLAHDWRLIGRTSLLMFPIYGMGALLSPIGTAVDCWIGELPLRPAEYLTGMWLRARGMCPWDYSGRQASVNGLIRLDFAPLWFMTGLLFEQITKKKEK